MKKVILARPSSLIVKDMKKLVSSIGFEAMPIAKISQLTEVNQEEVAAVVISTALTSTVKEKYPEVIQRSAAIFPGKPIFLASYATVRSTKITAGAHISGFGLHYELLSLEEAKNVSFDSNKQILILTQKEISNPTTFPAICELVKSIMKSPVSL